ncbi:MAG: Flp pilus assembly protein CpaB [Defluviicoccus sp.]|nr:Flp pilus assembly protein CpaB [Defluviicoccus sp.]MDE0276739.1 Flp pilus assembly protein CpaB [Defluviicoccus sp.]
MRRYRTVLILLLLVAVPLAGAVVAARILLPGEAPKQAAAKPKPAPVKPKPKTRKVVAAARALQVGTLLRAEDLTALDVAVSEVRREHVAMEGAKTIDSLRGRAVRQPIAADAPITPAALVGPGQRGFLAAVLRPGTRAATIRPGESVQHAGLIDPGDRVDVTLTARLRLDKGPDQVFTRTILNDVRVIAVDRQVGTGAAGGEDGEEVKRTKIVTATLEVSPAQANLLALGEQEGKLFLAVRPLAAAAATEDPAEAATLRDLLDLPEPEPEKRPEAARPAEPAPESEAVPSPPPRTVRVIRGATVSVETFGGEPGEPPAGGPAPRPGLPGVPVPAVGR